MAAKRDDSEQLFNRNLTALIAVIFLFYGGLSCLYSTLVPHLIELGFRSIEISYILTIVALISIIGPLIFAPLIDLIADRRKAQFGRYLQLILALLLILGAIAYGLLLRVPAVRRTPSKEPTVTFGCDSSGAVIFQRRCAEDKNCRHWDSVKSGSLTLTNCSYTCQNPENFESLYHEWAPERKPIEPHAHSIIDAAVLDSFILKDDDDLSYEDLSDEQKSKPKLQSQRRRRDVDRDVDPNVENPRVEPPHICSKKLVDNKTLIEKCLVYTKERKSLPIEAELHSAINQENDTNAAEWCRYPIDGFECHIPERQEDYMKQFTQDPNCKPMVECEVLDPYNESSVLAENKCVKTVGDFEVTYWSYLLIRSIADIFPVSIIVLLNTAVIIATRETSSGRSEIGRQLAWGALAWAIFPFIFGLCGIHGNIVVPVIVCIILWLFAALILIFTKSIPLSPPEWWWQIYTGDFMAIPLSAIRKYTPEIIALSFVAIVLGAFWSIVDTYQPSHLLDLRPENTTNLNSTLNATDASTTINIMDVIIPTTLPTTINPNEIDLKAIKNGTNVQLLANGTQPADATQPEFAIGAPKVIKFALTAAAIPAFFVLWNAEKIVDYCGHANVLIAAFALHIIRFTALSYIDAPAYALLTHTLESVTLVLVFITLVLYMRHLVPRRLITSGQAVPVIATLCIGNAIGTLVAPMFGKGYKSALFSDLAIVAAVVGCLYFILYHGYLGKRCAAAQQQPPSPQDLQTHNGSQSANGASNGNNYTPLRIYHNARGRKGHFRY